MIEQPTHREKTMSIASEYQRRREVAQRLTEELGKPVEAIHPNGTLGYKYVLGADRRAMSDAVAVRRAVRSPL